MDSISGGMFLAAFLASPVIPIFLMMRSKRAAKANLSNWFLVVLILSWIGYLAFLVSVTDSSEKDKAK